MRKLDCYASPKALEDPYGRLLYYLRLSITDVCNFRCQYCLPDGYQGSLKLEKFLSINEIQRVVTAFAELGLRKVRITGGEPTVRKDFVDIARMISKTPGINKTVFTTNGYRLRDHAQEWRDAGLQSINISVDSLNPDKFYKITGHDRLYEVLEGIDKALQAGFEQVKVNVVFLNKLNNNEVDDYLIWIKDKPISIRFIELMQTGENLSYFRKYHASTDIIQKKLISEEWILQQKSHDSGPALEYRHPDYNGSIGIIAPYSKDFCASCNRLRVTARGDLRLCLFGNSGAPLRHLLQSDDQKDMLKKYIIDQVSFKKSSHFLADGDTGITTHFASIGG